MSVAGRKTAQAFHACEGPGDFAAAFAAAAGEDVASFVGRFVPPERIEACLLVGSIPLRIATPASDVDLVVLVDDAGALRIDGAGGGDDRIVYSGRFGDGENSLVLAEVIAVAGGVETDVEFVAVDRLKVLTDRIARGGVALTSQEIRVLSRIKSGWKLSGRGSPADWHTALLRDNSLEVHCAVTNLSIALQDLEDARAALSDHLPLALYLGRSAVERCFSAYLASQGYAYLGTKWLRFLKHRADGSQSPRGPERELASTGLRLLFPAPECGALEAMAYLDHVARFIAETRGAIETNRAFGIALRMCPQVYDPVAAGG